MGTRGGRVDIDGMSLGRMVVHDREAGLKWKIVIAFPAKGPQLHGTRLGRRSAPIDQPEAQDTNEMPVVVKNGGGAPGAIGIKLDRDLWLFRQSTAKVLYDRHALPYDDVGVGDSGHSVEQDDVPRLPVDEGENHGGRGDGYGRSYDRPPLRRLLGPFQQPT